MKKIFLISISFLFLVVLNSTTVYATSPVRLAVANETSISGLIPLSENDLEIRQNTFTVDFLSESNMNVERYIERSANVTLSYEIYNPGDDIKIDFALPFISNFSYLTKPVDIKVNNLDIDSEFLFSDYLDYDSNNNYTHYYIDFSYDNYSDIMFDNYVFKNELDGYLYTVINPKASLNKNKVNTEVVFLNASSEAIFISGYGSFRAGEDGINIATNTYDSGAIVYFFATEELDTQILSEEYNNNGYVYSSTGKMLDPAKVTTSPIKLSDYISLVYNEENDIAYKEEFLKNFHKQIDYYIELYGGYYLSRSYNDALDNYYLFASQFSVDFKSQTNTTIEISYDIPIFCEYKNRYKESQMRLEFIPNPGNKYKVINNSEIVIFTNEKLISSSITHIQNDDRYTIIKDDNSDFVSVVLNNSEFKGFGCMSGCSSITLNQVISLGLFLLVVIVFRRKKY